MTESISDYEAHIDVQAKTIKQLRNDRRKLFNENIELQERIRYLESEAMRTKLSSTKGEGWFR